MPNPPKIAPFRVQSISFSGLRITFPKNWTNFGAASLVAHRVLSPTDSDDGGLIAPNTMKFQ